MAPMVWQGPQWHRLPGAVFPGPSGQVTADFPYAITNFRNQAMKLDQIDSATLCNAQRRGFAACAAFTFGLGYELWAKEEVTAEEPELFVPADSPSSNSNSAASKKKASPKPASVADPVERPPRRTQRPFSSASSRPTPKRTKTFAALGRTSMRERFEEAKAVEALNIDWLHTEEQVTHTELFVTQYEAQLQQNQAKAAA